MRPNEAGRMVVEEWRRLGERFEHVHPADLVVMPNHLHGILRFTSVGEPLGRIVSAFKSITTVAYVRGVRHRDWPTFDSQLWQRNYWERVLRDDDEVAHARAYIRDNPVYWRTDRLHPDHP